MKQREFAVCLNPEQQKELQGVRFSKRCGLAIYY